MKNMNQYDKKVYDDLKTLINKRLVEVNWYYRGPFDSGFLLKFEDGQKLTAQDGEYGDNAFKFIKEENENSN